MIDREIHKILIPVDDSKMSDRAFDYGMDMAKLFGAEVHVIYVANAPSAELQKFLNILTSSIYSISATVDLGK